MSLSSGSSELLDLFIFNEQNSISCRNPNKVRVGKRNDFLKYLGLSYQVNIFHVLERPHYFLKIIVN